MARFPFAFLSKSLKICASGGFGLDPPLHFFQIAVSSIGAPILEIDQLNQIGLVYWKTVECYSVVIVLV